MSEGPLPETSLVVTVRGCQRCGADHADMRFDPLDNAVDEWSYWGMCPTKQQPVLLRVVADEEGDAASE